LQGYTPKQLDYRTGGPSNIEHHYTEAMLRDFFARLSILELKIYESDLTEGTGHRGRSALIGVVARRSPVIRAGMRQQELAQLSIKQ